MGILSFLDSCKHKASISPPPVDVDLVKFTVGHSELGKPLSQSDFFTEHLRSSDVYKDEENGFEVGTEDHVLDYIFLTLNSFSGQFLFGGTPLTAESIGTEEQIEEVFGEPYWVDRSDGEVIMFYEYNSGTIELQFEFSDGRNLTYVTIARNGVLSTEEQRRAYGVDKAWPPRKQGEQRGGAGPLPTPGFGR
jgi:hypothetical protein